MNTKILVIDDHRDAQQVIELSLEEHGYQVLAARSGREGIALAQMEQPQLILLDIMMPDMDGYEVCRVLRQDEQLARVPVIMFSAKMEAADKLAGFDAGADDYLTKPTRPNELAQRVELLLKRQVNRPEPPATSRPEDKDHQIIALLGARGGVGTTTAAINIAASLAASGQETVLADLDLVHGHIAGYLNEPVRHNISQLFDKPLEEKPDSIKEYLQDRSPQWQLLLTRPLLYAAPPLTATGIDNFLDLVSDVGKTFVMDFGDQFGAPLEPVIRRADQVLLCLRPERAAVDAARRLLPYLRQHRPEAAGLHVIMFDYGMGVRLPRSAVENYIQNPLLDELVVHGEELAKAVNAGQALVEMVPQAPISRRFQNLAHQLSTVAGKV